MGDTFFDQFLGVPVNLPVREGWIPLRYNFKILLGYANYFPPYILHPSFLFVATRYGSGRIIKEALVVAYPDNAPPTLNKKELPLFPPFMIERKEEKEKKKRCVHVWLSGALLVRGVLPKKCNQTWVPPHVGGMPKNLHAKYYHHMHTHKKKWRKEKRLNPTFPAVWSLSSSRWFLIVQHKWNSGTFVIATLLELMHTQDKANFLFHIHFE